VRRWGGVEVKRSGGRKFDNFGQEHFSEGSEGEEVK